MMPRVATTVRLLRDAGRLYVAFDCAEPDLARVVARRRGHDQDVWTDDSVEMFLRLGGRNHHFIANPAGVIIKGPVFNEETLVHAEIDLGERDLAKAYFDCVGHYSRPDLLSLRIHDEAWTPTGPKKL